MKVFVADHAFDVRKIGIGGGGLVRQHVLGVEDIEALVLHGAHVEVAGGHDHEAFQVQRQAKAGFVPDHGGHQRMHGVFGFVHVAGAHIDLQQMLFAGAGGDALLATDQLACHQRKQVARLLVRVDPGRKVAAFIARAFQGTGIHQVAVGQQHRVFLLVGAQRHGVVGHHIRTVQKIGDAPETLGFALGEERVVADVQARQAGVFQRLAGGEDFQFKRAFQRQVFQHQLAAVELERGALAIDQHTRQIQRFTVKPQRLHADVRVAAQCHFVEHAGLGRVQVKRQVNAVDPERRGAVVGAANHRGRAV